MRQRIHFEKATSLGAPVWVALLATSVCTAFAQKPGPKSAVQSPQSPKVTQAANTPASVPAAPPSKHDPFAVVDEPVPGGETGPLFLPDLIERALYFDGAVLRRLGDLEVAHAKRKAVTDWENPELRFSYGADSDVQVGQPYSERIRRRENYQGTELRRQSAAGIDPGSGFFESRTDIERTRFRESSTTYIDRRITPGSRYDKIEDTIYQVEKETASGSRNRRDFREDSGEEVRDARITDARSRKIVGRTVTYREHPDTTEPDESFSVLVRFPLPHPWEMKANIKLAEAEIREAEYALEVARNEVIFSVRAAYEELAYHEALGAAWNQLSEHRDEFKKISKKLATLGLSDKLAASVDRSMKASREVLENAAEAEDVRLSLAKVCGVKDPSRIVVPKGFRRRVVDLRNVRAESLIELAALYRADLGQIHAKNQIARAEHAAVQARKIPFSTFIDFGWERQWDRGERDTDHWMVRLGVSLPLWDWLINDEEKVHAAEARSTSRQIGRIKALIDVEVTSALKRLQMIEAHLAKFEKGAKEYQKLGEEAVAAGVTSKNALEIQSEAQEIALNLQVERIRYYKLYNDAVLKLEEALGTRLEKITTPKIEEVRPAPAPATPEKQ